MSLVVADCRRWQGHESLSGVPLNALNQPRVPFVPKLGVQFFGRRQESLRPKCGVKIMGGLQRSNFLSIPSELESGRWMTRSLSELRSSTEVSDGGEERDKDHRPKFDLDLAVLLAGFSFESYNTPAETEGVLEKDGREIRTTYLSREFVKSIYDGQLFVHVKNGVNFPGLDFWGTSDPYVVLRIGHSSVRSRTIWGDNDPVWNENLTISMKRFAGHKLQVQAMHAKTFFTDGGQLGKSSTPLDALCDGKKHSIPLDLEGPGGGAQLFLEVQYKSFAQIRAEKNQVSLAGVFRGELLASGYKSGSGENGISAGEVLGDCMSMLNSAEGTAPKPIVMQIGTSDKPKYGNPVKETGDADKGVKVEIWRNLAKFFSKQLTFFRIDISGVLKDKEATRLGESIASLGLQSQTWAEFVCAENGLAIIDGQTGENQTLIGVETNGGECGKGSVPLPGGKEVFEGSIKQTVAIARVSIFNKSQGENQGGGQKEPTATVSVTAVTTTTTSEDDEDIEIITTKYFGTPESAIKAWVGLDTLAGPWFGKSHFEKICFLENRETDTQVDLWRDSRHKRLVVAFRGTQKTRLRDVLTDLRLFVSGFNPERRGSNLMDEPLVHAGFHDASKSVKKKLLSLVQATMSYSGQNSDESDWHIYVTGHSLGGALATIFALQLSESDLAKDHNLKVTMYNFGSPRVGNRAFADCFNKRIKDSWRVVNHKDIVPTVPWLLGYCHVAQPLYLTADKSPVSDLLEDGYDGDVIGESTLALIVDKFRKGHLSKLFKRQISMLWAIRDGSAVQQHMENFYYISLKERVNSSNGSYQQNDVIA